MVAAAAVASTVASTDVPQGSTEEPAGASAAVAPRGAAVLETQRVVGGDQLELRGWSAANTVEIIVDGIVVDTVTTDRARLDVAVATGLDDADAGFAAIIDRPSPDSWVCVAAPGSTPGPTGCDRTVLDLDRHRVVAFYGVPGVPVLGTLGSGSASAVVARLETQAAPYQTAERPVLPAFEIIATVAQATAGRDGDYSAPIDPDTAWEYLEAVRSVGGHVVLDFQPGQASYLDQFELFADLIAQPDVHLALDPEWDMLPGQVPGQVVGHTTAADINVVMAWIDDLVTEHRLPPKLLIVHQFQTQMIRDRPALSPPDSVQLLLQMDGHGGRALKTGNYARLADSRFYDGFKIFYQRDTPVLEPAEVLELDPEVDLISYQ